MIDRIDDVPLDDELAARFARLDRVDAPDTWDRAIQRSESPDPGRRTKRWWAAAAAVVLVVGGVAAVASTRGDDTSLQDDVSLQDTVLTDPSGPSIGSDPEAAVSAPSSTDRGADSSPYGSATVEPASVLPGATVTVTPNGVIEPTCGDFGAVFRVDGSSLVRLGVVATDGSFVAEDQRPTIPACLRPSTDEPASFTIPVDIPSGGVSICRTVDFSDAACGQLIIADPNRDDGASITMPIVEGLTEYDAITTLRALDLTVSVGRVELEPGNPSDGRIVAQSPTAAMVVATDDVVTITVGKATAAAEPDEDLLGQALRELDVDHDGAPRGAASLDGARFCGSERTGVEGFLSVDIDVAARRCLLDHHAARLPAVFVSELLTGAESRIVVVYRTRADGTAGSWIAATNGVDDSTRWDMAECGQLTDSSNASTPAVAFSCDADVEPLTEPIDVEPLPFPEWFDRRTQAPSCGYYTPQVEVRSDRDVPQPLVCMADAIEDEERAELVTLHFGDEMRVARWIVSIGPSPQGTPQFEVASLVVDLRTGTTRWAETRCVEGFLVDGRLVGDFIVGRGQVDQLDPSGTVVTDSGEVVIQPGPDERGQVQQCNGPQRVERPFVTPFEATGQRIGDVGPEAVRFPGVNEVGEYDVTIVRSWDPVALAGEPGIVGFIPSESLEFLPPPDGGEPPDPDRTLYDDDGVTRVGEFGSEGAAILD